MVNDRIRHQLAFAPKSPGVYLFKNESGQFIYIGKAANLRNRVMSYFGSKAGFSTKTVRLVSAVAEVEFIEIGSEQEALVLEADLIRQYRPLYNARLKDDKSFPFLKIDVESDWPTVSVTRRRGNDGARYFGPFASARSMRQTLRLIRKVFRFRVCSGSLEGKKSRACLNMDIGLCPGPCVQAISREDYHKTIDRIVMFLEGRHGAVLDSLVHEMKEAAEQLDFERAALLRDRVQAVDLITNRYGGVTALRGDQDILAVAQEGSSALVAVFSVREGRVVGREDFAVENTASLLPSEVLRGFLLEYYGTTSNLPPVIMLQHPVADAGLIRAWLSGLRGAPVRLTVPRKGVRKQLLDTVADGASRQLVARRVSTGWGSAARESGLQQLKDELGLAVLPRRIEGYDVSTTQGSDGVGSMVVFEDGIPKPSEYRRFKIRDVVGQDDYAMLREVLRRRFARMTNQGKSGGKSMGKWTVTPSLILVDGGRGQIGVALSVRDEYSGHHVPVVGLAKEYEHVYYERGTEPLDFKTDSPGLLLLQAVRDEAHRFAVAYHRNLRDTSMVASLFNDVPGIGPRRKRALFLAFDSIAAIRAASAEEIAEGGGIPIATARLVKERTDNGLL